jgi:hypothetical protein
MNKTTMSNAQVMISIEHILNDMDDKAGKWSDMEAQVHAHLSQAWRLLSNDPEVQAVFK